jgi:Flp pilus assembly protein TadD
MGSQFGALAVIAATTVHSRPMDCQITLRWIATTLAAAPQGVAALAVRTSFHGSLVAVAAFTLVIGACQGPPSTEQSIERGNHYLEFGKWQEAADAFQPVIKNSPGKWEAEYGYGVAMANLGDLVTARRCLETANDESPGNIKVIESLADVMFRQNDTSAMYQLLRGAGASLGTPDPWITLGLYAIRLKDNDSAQQAFAAAIEVDSGAIRPRTTEPYYQMAMLQLTLGRKDEAVRRLRQAYGISASDPRVVQALQGQGITIDAATALPPGL